MRAALIVVAVTLGSFAPAWAADLRSCAAIDVDGERLACYDALAGRDQAPARIAAPAPTAPSVASVASVPSPAAAVADSSPAAEPTSPGKTADGVVRAHIVGNFDGWHDGTQFTLDNGEVWRVAEEGITTYRPRDNPAVKIKKGFLGSYLLEIDELNARVKVERVR